MNNIIILGWIGTFGIIFAYTLLSLGVYTGNSLWYFVINTISSVLVIISSLSKKDYPPVGLNLFLVVVGLIAIIRILL